MKFFRTLLIAGLLVFSFQTAFSQKKLDGKVVEIIDGKTVVIEVSTTKNRFTAELEYIEIPEPEQQLSQTIKEHLQKLLLGKNVEFVARVLLEKKLIGKLYVGEIDVSQQLLRDGAAWYAVLEKDKQETTERETYQIVEAQAKLEKTRSVELRKSQTGLGISRRKSQRKSPTRRRSRSKSKYRPAIFTSKHSASQT
ncbi:MAG: hypothetical protein HC846_07715 [Blastocatellia bacterium]|nr:hypothetical protein [Blastocatellia bacterium]